MSYKDLPSKIKSLKPCKIILIGHRSADADALVSIELFKFIGKLNRIKLFLSYLYLIYIYKNF